MGHAKTNGGRAARAALGTSALALLLLCLALAPSALAGPPNHPRKVALDITGLNHACGAAADSKGDVYAASAGESKIKVFDPEHKELTFIEDKNEPCGLAVDSRGDLFVSEAKTGNVVRYVPDAYPFAGTPVYGPPEAIDSSGKAAGVAVDTTPLLTNSNNLIGGDDSLYIAKGDHIDAYRNETQGLKVAASGGSFKLKFEGQETAPLPFNASHAEVQTALEGLSTIGKGNVSVTTANFLATDHLVTFVGKLGLADVAKIEVDASGLTGSVVQSETNGGPLTPIGEGALTEASGVAAYTNRLSADFADRYVFAADKAGEVVKVFSGPTLAKLKLRRTIEGPKEGEDFGFGTAGAYLAVDPGNRLTPDKPENPTSWRCEPTVAQACTAGHLLVYDEAHKVLDEFEANGRFLDQLSSAGFEDAEPTGLVVERSDGAGDGTIYVGAGKGAGAKLLAFGPLGAPSRPVLAEPLSKKLATAKAVAVDSKGDVYAAAGLLIKVYGPDGKEIKVGPSGEGIETEDPVVDLAVDSSGKVYELENIESGNRATELVQYYTPESYPPKDGTKYAGPTKVADGNSFEKPDTPLHAIGINPANDHVFVANSNQIIELDSAAKGSTVLNKCFACGPFAGILDIAPYGANGDVYISTNPRGISIVNPTGTEVLSRIGGAGSAKGAPLPSNPVIAVDQSNGHVFSFEQTRGVAEEYEASGAFVAQFGGFTKEALSGSSRIAIDNSGGPSDGNVYVAFDDPAKGTFDLTAFGPLFYPEVGEPPVAATGVADGFGPASATLHGTVDPRGSLLGECAFEYLTDAEYKANGKTFAGAATKGCAETPAEIGAGNKPVAVHADLAGLDPEAAYRFRLLAKNAGGESHGEPPGLFGPPLLTTKTALPVGYGEATLRAGIDPSGLATKYSFQYGTSEAYGQSTPVAELASGDGSVAVAAPITGLAEGTEYHFRVLAENEAKAVAGPDQAFTTLARRGEESCPNAEFRSGLSANLPDCRAYELVTLAAAVPAPVHGVSPGDVFNDWLVAPRGPGAGESLAYSSLPVPGLEGSGETDGFRAQRAAGEHPAAGWTSEILNPSYVQLGGGGSPSQRGFAPDQRYSFWKFFAVDPAKSGIPSDFPPGQYLRTPAGFEALGQGSLGVDPSAESRFLSAGGAHAIFTSDQHLEPGAAPQGTTAVYDRAAGAAGAAVVSVKPDGSPFVEGQDATYVGTSEDGSAVVFAQNEVQKVEVNATGGSFTLSFEGQETASISYNATAEDVQKELEKLGKISNNVKVVGGPTGEIGPTLKPYVVIFTGSKFANGNPPALGCVGALTGGAATCTAKTEVGSTLYLHREGETIAIAEPPYSFAGVSDDGTRVFYVDVISTKATEPAGLFACDVGAGPCAGPGSHAPTEIAPASIFVDVPAADPAIESSGSAGDLVYFTSKQVLDDASEGHAGEDNLYLYDGAATSLLAVLDPRDLDNLSVEEGMRFWATAIRAGQFIGRGKVPTRTTPDGGVLLFQSHAQLTAYDNEGQGEVYRYERGAAAGERLLCVSCDPTGAPPSGDALLQFQGPGAATQPENLVPNVTEDGGTVFFQSPDRLLPEDANDALDVYEWKAQGAVGCERAGGCLALISSGQGEGPSLLYGMSADGHDVFFKTAEKLVGQDIPSIPSLYDARIGGGIPDPPAKAPCQGDACQGQGSPPPILGVPASAGSGGGDVTKGGRAPCAKGKHRAKGRCVATHRHKRHHKRRRPRAGHHRRAGR